MMLDIFKEGGAGMYPTLALGLITVVLTLRYWRAPQRGFSPAIWWMGAATALSGLLGFLTGSIRTFQAIHMLPPLKQFPITLLGLGESMWNLVLALCLLTITSIIAAAGWRQRQTAGTFAQR